jgi:hypothetical protein
MTNFILLGKDKNQFLLNLNSVKQIKPYNPPYDALEGLICLTEFKFSKN